MLRCVTFFVTQRKVLYIILVLFAEMLTFVAVTNKLTTGITHKHEHFELYTKHIFIVVSLSRMGCLCPNGQTV